MSVFFSYQLTGPKNVTIAVKKTQVLAQQTNRVKPV